jgi:hypothetical protein
VGVNKYLTPLKAAWGMLIYWNTTTNYVAENRNLAADKQTSVRKIAKENWILTSSVLLYSFTPSTAIDEVEKDAKQPVGQKMDDDVARPPSLPFGDMSDDEGFESAQSHHDASMAPETEAIDNMSDPGDATTVTCESDETDDLHVSLEQHMAMMLNFHGNRSLLGATYYSEPTEDRKAQAIMDDYMAGIYAPGAWDKSKCLCIPGPWKEDTYFHMHLITGDIECYKVDQDTDTLTEEEIVNNWKLVEEADRKEIKQFVDEKCFKKIHRYAVDGDTVPFDAIYIRKWKKMPNGTRIVKTRLCARGCLDRQKHLIPTRSTTATRLSQRLIVSLSVLLGFSLESWDVSGAFLKGFSFDRIKEVFDKMGIRSPKRKVVIAVPANVWRHFNALEDKALHIDIRDVASWLLEALKAIYGLGDAPLAWQLCLFEFFVVDLQGCQSQFDENFFIWFHPTSCEVDALASAHVDDNNVASKAEWLADGHRKMEKRFGKITRQTLPFTHTGLRHEDLADGGRKIHQDEFCQKLVPLVLDPTAKDDRPLTKDETTDFRSILGGLLWLCLTRMDVIADVVLLQQELKEPLYKHLREANKVLVKAQKYAAGCGLYFKKLVPPLRLVTVADTCGSSKKTAYAQEAVFIVLMEDRDLGNMQDNGELTEWQCRLMSGAGHLLASSAGKARRIGGSTSYNETLGGCRGKELAQLVAMRLAEIFSYRARLTVAELIQIQTDVSWPIPIDHYTDCGDFFELVTGSKGCPQDKTQRLHVLSVREDRITRRIRFFVQIPTESMLVDALTKVMLSGLLMTFLTSGYYRIQHADHKVRLRVMPGRSQYSEKDLETMGENKNTQAKKITTTSFASTCSFSIPVVIAFMLAESADSASKGLVKYVSSTALQHVSVTGPISGYSSGQVIFAVLVIAAAVMTIARSFVTTTQTAARDAMTQSPVVYLQGRSTASGKSLAVADYVPGRFDWKAYHLSCDVGAYFDIDRAIDGMTKSISIIKVFIVVTLVYTIAYTHGYSAAATQEF